MVGTRGKGEATTGSNHVGFRCVKSANHTDLSKNNDFLATGGPSMTNF
jgi:hypothetical protein